MSVAKPFPMKGCETPVFNKLRANDAIGFVFDCPQKTLTLSGLPKTSMDSIEQEGTTTEAMPLSRRAERRLG